METNAALSADATSASSTTPTTIVLSTLYCAKADSLKVDVVCNE